MRVRRCYRRFGGHARVSHQVSSMQLAESIAPRDIGGRAHILVKIDGLTHREDRDRRRVVLQPGYHPAGIGGGGQHRLIAVNGDPLSDVKVLETVTFVLKGGAVIRNDSGATK